MYYGTAPPPEVGGLRRKNTISGGRDSPDPTVIPTTNYFGFLGRLGFRGRGMRYKPSAANLQEHPQRGWDTVDYFSRRRRSGTGSIGSGGESLRSRGDLWPSEDEDDAVVIGDDAFPRSSDGESGRDLLLDEPEDGGRRYSQDTERGMEGEETEREKERRQQIEEALNTVSWRPDRGFGGACAYEGIGYGWDADISGGKATPKRTAESAGDNAGAVYDGAARKLAAHYLSFHAVRNGE